MRHNLGRIVRAYKSINGVKNKLGFKLNATKIVNRFLPTIDVEQKKYKIDAAKVAVSSSLKGLQDVSTRILRSEFVGRVAGYVVAAGIKSHVLNKQWPPQTGANPANSQPPRTDVGAESIENSPVSDESTTNAQPTDEIPPAGSTEPNPATEFLENSPSLDELATEELGYKEFFLQYMCNPLDVPWLLAVFIGTFVVRTMLLPVMHVLSKVFAPTIGNVLNISKTKLASVRQSGYTKYVLRALPLAMLLTGNIYSACIFYIICTNAIWLAHVGCLGLKNYINSTINGTVERKLKSRRHFDRMKYQNAKRGARN